MEGGQRGQRQRDRPLKGPRRRLKTMATLTPGDRSVQGPSFQFWRTCGGEEPSALRLSQPQPPSVGFPSSTGSPPCYRSCRLLSSTPAPPLPLPPSTPAPLPVLYQRPLYVLLASAAGATKLCWRHCAGTAQPALSPFPCFLVTLPSLPCLFVSLLPPVLCMLWLTLLLTIPHSHHYFSLPAPAPGMLGSLCC